MRIAVVKLLREQAAAVSDFASLDELSQLARLLRTRALLEETVAVIAQVVAAADREVDIDDVSSISTMTRSLLYFGDDFQAVGRRAEAAAAWRRFIDVEKRSAAGSRPARLGNAL
ncbi:hypothetical protein AB0M45_12300 [Nocardia sp. NPDC051787]|uniref:hypothetical protein n=1 Tax=Nocardia sp. NPDC051787 TaxID=3155415 RepID=UPI0034151F12